ncbi:RNA polymerase sigma factor [Agathobaculum sp. Marseille-P7918]|uniref:RNA polymerase sigma factor n=1 Tax=Agathobaculum sp. Marseille-P7918 TaxID=2479843 RepID=UPI0035674278
MEAPEEKSKFEQLYLEYRDLMFYVANGILHNQQDAEDVVHESFLKIIKIIGKIESPKSPKTKNLIVIVTEKTAIDLYRRHKKRFLEPLDEERFSVFSPSELEITERKMSIAFAIAALPAKYWEVLLLRYDNGFSEEEAAQIMSMSLENVHKTIQRAKKRLKQILEEREE